MEKHRAGNNCDDGWIMNGAIAGGVEQQSVTSKPTSSLASRITFLGVEGYLQVIRRHIEASLAA